ncbi:hypothetical protein QTI24_21760 [Variovorax sp. J22P240]|uniref:hypothetical protein n=1 Tax=Variovorax TaxID=34072 RepID=UPI0025783455|nr:MULTISPECIES: hypothetical protein [unclassified Variovorax]MDM0001248.1 hypothetical protein [Variovorax sp. J22P240]MDM0110170.1 hypothetical protein [Variovorax sp. J22R24]
MTSDLYGPTRLLPGQKLRLSIDKGFSLVAEQGTVSVVSPPTWFGDTVFTNRSVLFEGEAYVAEDDGWIEVCAISPARVHALPRTRTPFS